MSNWEPQVGVSDEWYTPPEIFNSLKIKFDLDPCSPGKGHWVPADYFYTKKDNGLNCEWNGTVFMNPPFGKRNSHIKWVQ